MKTKYKKYGTNRKSAYTIVECLIALLITAIILAAVAVAFNAAAINYDENSDLFNAVNTARQSLLKITNDLRTANSVSIAEPNSQCTIITSAGQNITYSYDAVSQIVYLITNNDDTDEDSILAKDVTAMTVTKNIGVKDAVSFVKSVQISITIKKGRTEKTLTAASVIRKNLD
ncbi:MAG: hypothetical protein FVQ80_04210 [Planctomycetes bacterium]|nr:hypothetical protein [Planctomycetota bacterium]